MTRQTGGVAVGEVQVDDRTLTAAVIGGADALMRALGELQRERVAVLDVGLRRPTLDDVFLTLTGRAAEVDAASKTKTQTKTESETGSTMRGVSA